MSKKIEYKHYTSFEYLPTINYYKIADSDVKDYRWLLKLKDYSELPDIDCKYLKEVYDNIEHEVKDYGIKLNRSQKIEFDKYCAIDKLELQLQRIQVLLLALSYEYSEDNVKLLAELGYTINPNKDYQSELKRIYKRSKNIETRIGVKENELKKPTPNQKQTDIDELIDGIERYRNMAPGSIDPHVLPLKRWLIIYYKASQEIEQNMLKNG
jgi:hypothetical protein